MEKLARGKPQVPTLSRRKNIMILAVTIASLSSFIIHSGTKKEAGSSSNHHFSGVQGLFNFGRVDSIYAPVDGNGWKWPECTAFDVVWNGVSILWADTWCWSCCPSPMFIEFQVRNCLKLSERIWNSSVELIWGFHKFTDISYSCGVMNFMIR